MTETNLEQHKQSAWSDFWLNLKEGYDAFEKTKRPPYVSVCDGRYRVDEMSASPPEAGASGPLAVCGPTAAALLDSDKSAWLVPLAPKGPEPQQAAANLPLPDQAQSNLLSSPPSPNSPSPEQPAPQQTPMQPPLSPVTPITATVQQPQMPISLPLHNPSPPKAKTAVPATAAEFEIENRKAVASVDPAHAYELVPRLVAPAPRAGSGTRAQGLPCSLSLASCRKYAAMLSGRSAKSKPKNGLAKVRTASRAR